MGVGLVPIKVSAKDHAALIGLGDVKMRAANAEDHHVVQQWLQWLGNKSLQFVGFNRQFPQFGHPPKTRGVSCNGKADFLRANDAA